MSRVYLGAAPLDQARARFLAAADLTPRGEEKVATVAAAGRVTARVVLAGISSPHYHASAMDGYAMVAAATFGASERTPVRLPVAAEAPPAADVATVCVRLDTGDPLPDWCDAVVPLEDAIPVDDGRAVELRSAVHPWQDVRVQGEDIVAGQVLFGVNHRLEPADIGLLLAAGVLEVAVWRRPVVTFIPTGDEILSPSALQARSGRGRFTLEPGAIIESNGTVARLRLEAWGCEVRLLDPVPDDPARIGPAVDAALAASDLVLIGAGSSAGRDDHTSRIVAERGEVLVHGVAVRPGKPVILGVAAGKPLVGLPGYPVSSALALELYVRPMVFAWQGRPEPASEAVTARLGRAIQSPLGVDEFVRVKVARVEAAARPDATPYVVVPMPRGAGLLSGLSQADGQLRVPANREGFEAGSLVSVALSRPRAEVDQALLVTGSHDLLLDLLASRLAAIDPSLSLSSGRAGSLGGLLALRDGLCHLAGAHLLDETSGEYNRPWVERLLPGRSVVLLTLAWRRQGLMVRPGNPKGITGLGDLTRSDVVFINRQRGSGTRVLLDYHLGREGIDPSAIQGYRREEGSHLGVASAVGSGAADVGLGIRAAASALGLEFIPVAEERYDLIYVNEFADDPRLGRIRDILTGDAEFRSAAESLGGYDLRDTGRTHPVDGKGGEG